MKQKREDREKEFRSIMQEVFSSEPEDIDDYVKMNPALYDIWKRYRPLYLNKLINHKLLNIGKSENDNLNE